MASTMKKSGHRAAIIASVAAVGAAAAAIAVVLTSKSASASTPSAPVAPSGQVPVWTQLTPQGAAGAYYVTVPAGASFAFSDPAGDPNLTNIVAGLNQAATNGTVAGTAAYQAGSAPPSFWPPDGMGSNAYRASGVAQQTFNLSLGPLSSTSPSSGPQVWVATAFAPAA